MTTEGLGKDTTLPQEISLLPLNWEIEECSASESSSSSKEITEKEVEQAGIILLWKSFRFSKRTKRA